MESQTSMDPNGSKTHLYAGLAFAVIALVAFVALILIRSSADESATSVNVNNQSPTLGSITISGSSYGATLAGSGVTLTENATTTIYIYGNATDLNGCQEIDTTGQFTGTFYRTNVSGGAACTPDNNDCYALTSATVDQCDAVDGTDTVERYQFSKAIEYYADPTDAGAPSSATNWTASVTVTDDSSATGTATTTVEMNTLLALNVTSTIPYGSVALSGTSSEKTVTLTNTGNIVMSALTSGTTMPCTLGTLAIATQHWNLSPSFGYGAGTALSGTPTSMANATAQRTDDSTPITSNSYWSLQLPASGVSGSCTGTNTFTAS